MDDTKGNINQAQLLEKWAAIGHKNRWIREADDPSFHVKMLVKCETSEQLEKRFKDGNWCLGQGFYYQNLCFINQINGGDEWLTIRDDYPFESITFERIIESGEFYSYIDRLLNATKEQCLNLTY